MMGNGVRLRGRTPLAFLGLHRWRGPRSASCGFTDPRVLGRDDLAPLPASHLILLRPDRRDWKGNDPRFSPRVARGKEVRGKRRFKTFLPDLGVPAFSALIESKVDAKSRLAAIKISTLGWTGACWSNVNKIKELKLMAVLCGLVEALWAGGAAPVRAAPRPRRDGAVGGKPPRSCHLGAVPFVGSLHMSPKAWPGSDGPLRGPAPA